jgi:hypothetical protein
MIQIYFDPSRREGECIFNDVRKVLQKAPKTDSALIGTRENELR